MLGISIKPVLRFIALHGVDIAHHRQTEASPDAPWQVAAETPASTSARGGGVMLKGLIQHIKAERTPELPAGSFRAMAVLALPRGGRRPLPGDSLNAEAQRWRVESIMPLAQHRSGTLLEAKIVSYGGFAGGGIPARLDSGGDSA